MSPAIKFLGAVVLRRSDGVVDDATVPTSKALDLLRLLVAANGRERSADHYIGQLWPTVDDSRGRMSLRTAVAQLRRALGPDVVSRSGDLVTLGDVDSDIDQLRRGAEAVEGQRRLGQDTEVVRLVQELEAECGADLVVSSGSCEAVYALRDELRELRGRMLLEGAAAAASLGLARQCLDLAQRADGLLNSETSARAVMVAWSSVGETRRAVETFERLRANLEVTYGVQPSPETRALYLQVVTAGDGLSLRPVEHHRDVVVDLAAMVVELVDRDEPGGVIWLQGEPGSGRGAVAREAVRLLGTVASVAADDILILPEVIALDDLERRRLRREARAERAVLLVPVRRPIRAALSSDEASLRVEPLDRTEFRELVSQLLQERPSRMLEERLWSTTGGLAGHACRTVAELVRSGHLRWGPGEVRLPPRRRLAERRLVTPSAS